MPLSEARRERLIEIRDHARQLFNRANAGACCSLAELIRWYDNRYGPSIAFPDNPSFDAHDLVSDLGYILTEKSEWLLDRDEDTDLYLGWGFAGDSCFRSLYQDGSNQVRHFWAYVMVGYQYGWFGGGWGALRELFPPEGADYLLGVMGIRLGNAVLRDGDWPMADGGANSADMADWIAENICDPECCEDHESAMAEAESDASSGE